MCYCLHICVVLSFEFSTISDFSSQGIMQDLPDTEPGEIQPPSNLQEINRCALNFRKLMLLFPYLHPAALHGVIVKNNFNWEQILPVLFAGQGARAEQFWAEVNEHTELEQALEQHGVRLVCCNGFNENQCHGVPSLDEVDDVQNTRSQLERESTCIKIIFEQNPPQNGEKNVPKTVCEVETEDNDVIRIIFGEKDDGLAGKKVPKTIEIVRVDSAPDGQPGFLIRNVTNTPESTPKEVQTVTKPKRTARAKAGEKKPRCRKPKVINEQNKLQVETKTATGGIKKGKASSNTRVKSSKTTSKKSLATD